MKASIYTQGKNPGTRWIGDWAGPRAGLDMCRKEKSPALAGTQKSVEYFRRCSMRKDDRHDRLICVNLCILCKEHTKTRQT